MVRLLKKIEAENDFAYGDCTYMAMELLSKDINGPIPDMKKADIFSLGISIYELIERKRLSKTDDSWRSLRSDQIPFSDNYSPQLQNLIRTMMASDPALRPNVGDLLNGFLISESEKENKDLKEMNRQLREANC